MQSVCDMLGSWPSTHPVSSTKSRPSHDHIDALRRKRESVSIIASIPSERLGVCGGADDVRLSGEAVLAPVEAHTPVAGNSAMFSCEADAVNERAKF